jgi:hypothetical protein
MGYFREVTDRLVEVEQAVVLQELAGPGARRRELAAELAELDRIVRPLAIRATSLGVTYRRVSELTGIPIPTVARWTKQVSQ